MSSVNVINNSYMPVKSLLQFHNHVLQKSISLFVGMPKEYKGHFPCKLSSREAYPTGTCSLCLSSESHTEIQYSCLFLMNFLCKSLIKASM